MKFLYFGGQRLRSLRSGSFKVWASGKIQTLWFWILAPAVSVSDCSDCLICSSMYMSASVLLSPDSCCTIIVCIWSLRSHLKSLISTFPHLHLLHVGMKGEDTRKEEPRKCVIRHMRHLILGSLDFSYYVFTLSVSVCLNASMCIFPEPPSVNILHFS